MRWSYKTLHFELKKEGLLGSSYLDEQEIERVLNECGHGGWELVSIMETGDGILAVLKRPVVTEQAGQLEKPIPECLGSNGVAESSVDVCTETENSDSMDQVAEGENAGCSGPVGAESAWPGEEAIRTTESVTEVPVRQPEAGLMDVTTDRRLPELEDEVGLQSNTEREVAHNRLKEPETGPESFVEDNDDADEEQELAVGSIRIE